MMWEEQVFHTGNTVWMCWLLIFNSVALFMWACVCKLWFKADAAESAAVRMERLRTDEREREGESVKGKAAASSCPDSLWTPVLGEHVCVRVCARSTTPSMRENAYSWLVIYSAKTTLGTEDRQTGCVCVIGLYSDALEEAEVSGTGQAGGNEGIGGSVHHALLQR